MKKHTIGILAAYADLYNRLCPGIGGQLKQIMDTMIAECTIDGIDFVVSEAVSTPQQIDRECRNLAEKKVDLLVVALAPYCPSGALAPSLVSIDVPVVLWPAQTMYRLDPEKYDADTIIFNHGVHAVQDLANVLRKRGRNFGILHGHCKEEPFRKELRSWAQAGAAIRALQKAYPVQIGGHFEDMLDLQIGAEEFITKVNIRHTEISRPEFSEQMQSVSQQQVARCLESYQSLFIIDASVRRDLLEKAARGEAALRGIMEKYQSCAFGLNFLELCNDRTIAEPLHVAGSILMSEGYGYAAEGDWVTAGFVYAMQQAFGCASFSEIFSVGYADHRLVLKHWGEGNFRMGRQKPKLLPSTFSDQNQCEFAIVDFEFEPGAVTLLNLNSTADGRGQLIAMTGSVSPDPLPRTNGPRGIFQPEVPDISEFLSRYARQGGSHHLALVKGDQTRTAEKICDVTGWKYIRI
ncbi:MAG: L-arabinose isomerase [Planctomycetes bacterium ADurb.Bin412]|nr:MAG: L-arabinose isomerase [Planctomycetes bacterium ADurb.Bin412]